MRCQTHRCAAPVLSEGEIVPRDPSHEAREVVEQMALDELYDAARARLVRDVIGALAKRRHGVRDGNRELREREKRVIVLGVADRDARP